MPRTENESYSSIYLGPEAKAKLIALSKASGKSRSQVMRDLIDQAGTENKIKILQLLEEVSNLMSAT